MSLTADLGAKLSRMNGRGSFHQLASQLESSGGMMTKLSATPRFPANGAWDHHFQGAPCIPVAFTFTPTWQDENNLTQMRDLTTVWALLDTGADYNCIDESLVPPGTLPIETVRTTGVNGVHDALNYELSLYIKDWSWSLKCGALTMPAGLSRPYSMILGRSFMQLVRFVYDGRTGISELEIIDNPMAH